MAGSVWYYLISGGWGIATVAAFIQAIRLSYRIEERSPDLRNRTGVPFYAAMPFTVTNWKVARDAETQALRRRMLGILGGILAGFVLFWLFLSLVGIV